MLGRLRPWLVVLAVLLLVGFARVRLLEMPLERAKSSGTLPREPRSAGLNMNRFACAKAPYE